MIKCKKCGKFFNLEFGICPYCGDIANSKIDECAMSSAGFSKPLTNNRPKKRKLLRIIAIFLLAAIAATCTVAFTLIYMRKKTVKHKSFYQSVKNTATEQTDSDNSKLESVEENVSAVETESSEKSEQRSAESSIYVSSNEDSQTVQNDEKSELNTGGTTSIGEEGDKPAEQKLLPGKYRLANDRYGMEDWYAYLTVFEDQSCRLDANCDLVSFKKVEKYSYCSTVKYVTEYIPVDPDGLNYTLTTQVFIKTPYDDFSGYVVDYYTSGERVAIQNQSVMFVACD